MLIPFIMLIPFVMLIPVCNAYSLNPCSFVRFRRMLSAASMFDYPAKKAKSAQKYNNYFIYTNFPLIFFLFSSFCHLFSSF